jgi:hypothetical protein
MHNLPVARPPVSQPPVILAPDSAELAVLDLEYPQEVRTIREGRNAWSNLSKAHSRARAWGRPGKEIA